MAQVVGIHRFLHDYDQIVVYQDGSGNIKSNMDRIRDRVMQEAIEEHLRPNPSLRTYKHVYIPAEKIAGLDDESRALYLLYKKISSRAAKASRARKKEESRALSYSM